MVAAARPLITPWLDPMLGSRAAAEDAVICRFVFNSECHALPPGFDWTVNPSRDEEWLILLHKFYYAGALGSAFAESGDVRYRDTWVRLARSWMNSVPLDFLPADVAGRRIQNWIFAHQYFGEIDGFHTELVASLQAQSQWLRANLTPARNHRTLELLALFLMAVAFPELPESAELLDFTRHELTANLETDFRPDGVHVEQSTDYHHIVLRNALIARRTAVDNGIGMPEGFDLALRRALRFATHIHRPDGTIPSLSDGDSGGFLDLVAEGAELFGDEEARYVASAGRKGRAPISRLSAFPDGGYYVLRSGWGDRDARWLVFDCGPLGEGNHGHLDLLSFEMYAYGRPLIVDPGRYTYDESGDVNWRVRFRGTAFHNTVSVDGLQQTRYEFHKRKFKIRGPEPRYQVLDGGEDHVRGQAISDMYDAVHEREIRLIDGRWFQITDTLTSPSEHTYDLYFHLSRDANGRTWCRCDGRQIEVSSPNLKMVIASSHSLETSIESGWISPSYGIKHASPVVRVRARGRSVRFETQLIPEKTS